MRERAGQEKPLWYTQPYPPSFPAPLSVHLTLLVPELIWPEPADRRVLEVLAAPGLEWVLARARAERSDSRPFEMVLAASFGLTAPPFGALRLLGEGVEAARSGHWLCADPVHLRFHHERIILADAGAFALDNDEAQSIVEALNVEFSDVGHFLAASGGRWYLRLNVAVDHPVEPISAVAGRLVDGERRGSALPLTRWLNEVQMFLHRHPLNERREAAGQPAINSLWLWGGGVLPAGIAPAFSAVFTDNPLAAGLARTAGIPQHGRPLRLDDLRADAGKQPLVVLDQLLARVLYEDSDGWRDGFEQLDAGWFIPLKKALGGEVDRISLLAPTVYGDLRYTLTAGDRWKLWKSGQPLAETARELAR
jgi:hypothetical protein